MAEGVNLVVSDAIFFPFCKIWISLIVAMKTTSSLDVDISFGVLPVPVDPLMLDFVQFMFLPQGQLLDIDLLENIILRNTPDMAFRRCESYNTSSTFTDYLGITRGNVPCTNPSVVTSS